MTPSENNHSFTVIRKFELLKRIREFEIRRSDSEEIVMRVTETTPGLYSNIFRVLNFGGMTPFNFDFFSPTGERQFTIERGVTWFASKIRITNNDNFCIGILKENLYTQDRNERFKLLDSIENQLYSIQFEHSTFNYKLVTHDNVVYSRVIRESKEITEKTKELAKKGNLLKTIYFVTLNTEMPANQQHLVLLFSSVVGLDLTVMRRFDEWMSY